MTETSGGFRFVSHQRRGLIALPGVAAAGTVSVSATLSDSSTTTPVTIGLNTVADVQGIDTTLVIRQYPRPDATDAETEFFPLVEFAAAELPWLLPTPNGAQGPLPWLCLVVVEQREGVSVTGSGLGRPDVLHIERPGRAGAGAARPLGRRAVGARLRRDVGADDRLAGSRSTSPPGRHLSGCRLVAPRRLLPDTSYTAALVPIFAASALAGLGRSDQEVAAALAAPAPNFAWATSDSSVDLPTYLHWDFSTGDGGDFESLARALVEVPVGPDFGTRPLDLGLAGAGMPETSTLGAIFRGALTAPGIADQVAWPDSSDADEGQRRRRRRRRDRGGGRVDRSRRNHHAARPAGRRPDALRRAGGRARRCRRDRSGDELVRPAQPRPAGALGGRHRHPSAAPQRRGRHGRGLGSGGRRQRSERRTPATAGVAGDQREHPHPAPVRSLVRPAGVGGPAAAGPSGVAAERHRRPGHLRCAGRGGRQRAAGGLDLARRDDRATARQPAGRPGRLGGQRSRPRWPRSGRPTRPVGC